MVVVAISSLSSCPSQVDDLFGLLTGGKRNKNKGQPPSSALPTFSLSSASSSPSEFDGLGIEEDDNDDNKGPFSSSSRAAAQPSSCRLSGEDLFIGQYCDDLAADFERDLEGCRSFCEAQLGPMKLKLNQALESLTSQLIGLTHELSKPNTPFNDEARYDHAPEARVSSLVVLAVVSRTLISCHSCFFHLPLPPSSKNTNKK